MQACLVGPCALGPRLQGGAFASSHRAHGFVIHARPFQTLTRGVQPVTRASASACTPPDARRLPSPEEMKQRVSERIEQLNNRFRPPKYLWRSFAALVIAGQSIFRIFQGLSVECGGAIHETRCRGRNGIFPPVTHVPPQT